MDDIQIVKQYIEQIKEYKESLNGKPHSKNTMLAIDECLAMDNVLTNEYSDIIDRSPAHLKPELQKLRCKMITIQLRILKKKLKKFEPNDDLSKLVDILNDKMSAINNLLLAQEKDDEEEEVEITGNKASFGDSSSSSYKWKLKRDGELWYLFIYKNKSIMAFVQFCNCIHVKYSIIFDKYLKNEIYTFLKEMKLKNEINRISKDKWNK